MRIAYVSSDLGIPPRGNKGGSIHIQETIRALVSLGHAVDLITTRWDGDEFLPAVVHEITVNRDSPHREQLAVRANRQAYRMLTQIEPNLVYERYSLWSCAGMKFAHDRSIPGVLEVNAPLVDEQRKYRRLRHSSSAKLLSQRCFGYASHIVAVSHGVAHYLEQFSTCHGKVAVVPNGVRIERFHRRRVATREVIIGFLGSLQPWHGVPGLIDAFSELCASHANVRLRIAGDGPARAEIETKVESQRKSVRQRIELLGHVPSDSVPDVLSEFDIAVAPYPFLEGFYFSPLKILEYMAAGLPVVASKQGDISSLVRHRETGLLYRPGDHRHLVQSLLDIVEMPVLRRQLMGVRGREFVTRHHTWRQVVTNILQLAAQRAAGSSTTQATL